MICVTMIWASHIVDQTYSINQFYDLATKWSKAKIDIIVVQLSTKRLIPIQILLIPVWWMRYSKWAMRLCNISTRNTFKISFVHNLFHSCPIVLKLSQHYHVWEKILNDWTTQVYIKDERGFARFEFKMNFVRIYYIAKSQERSVSVDIAWH